MKHYRLACPICKKKTSLVLIEKTEVRNFPLYCANCKKEITVNVIPKKKEA